MIEDKKLGLKVATKEEAYWINIKEKTQAIIEDMEKSLKLNKAILVMAENKIALENATNPRKKNKIPVGIG
jgi:hypothetical protein